MAIRRMPDPWFRAQAMSRAIYEIVHSQPYRLARDDERQLGPFVLPPFQRPSVWSRTQQIRLIESIWNGLPIGSYVYNQTMMDDRCDGWLLDGQQRVTAILDYVAGEFPVYGWRFPDLEVPEQREFRMRPIGALETRIADEALCREVYDRLAYGGTPHKRKDKGNA